MVVVVVPVRRRGFSRAEPRSRRPSELRAHRPSSSSSSRIISSSPRTFPPSSDADSSSPLASFLCRRGARRRPRRAPPICSASPTARASACFAAPSSATAPFSTSRDSPSRRETRDFRPIAPIAPIASIIAPRLNPWALALWMRNGPARAWRSVRTSSGADFDAPAARGASRWVSRSSRCGAGARSNSRRVGATAEAWATDATRDPPRTSPRTGARAPASRAPSFGIGRRRVPRLALVGDDGVDVVGGVGLPMSRAAYRCWYVTSRRRGSQFWSDLERAVEERGEALGFGSRRADANSGSDDDGDGDGEGDGEGVFDEDGGGDGGDVARAFEAAVAGWRRRGARVFERPRRRRRTTNAGRRFGE